MTNKVKIMTLDKIFENLWIQYEIHNPLIGQIHDLIETKEGGKSIVNDHIAFRTFNHPKVNIEVLSKIFIDLGYIEMGEYSFTDKKLNAKHFEKKDRPTIFISELILEECSPFLRETVENLIEQIPVEITTLPSLLWAGCLWDAIDSETYECIRHESEYASWICTFGYRANHFTISINDLRCFELSSLVRFLKNNDVEMNTAGGLIKGNARTDYLEQASTLAYKDTVEFSDISLEVPCCFYEFIQRYELPSGKLFTGFVTDNADNIFESTDVQDN